LQIGIGKPFKKSALQQGIKAIADKTWEQINRILIGYVQGEAYFVSAVAKRSFVG